VKPLRKICRGNRKRIAQSFPARSARRSKQFCSDAGQEECLNYAVLAGPRRGTLITLDEGASQIKKLLGSAGTTELLGEAVSEITGVGFLLKRIYHWAIDKSKRVWL
jgi:hypothetical protein